MRTKRQGSDPRSGFREALYLTRTSRTRRLPKAEIHKRRPDPQGQLERQVGEQEEVDRPLLALVERVQVALFPPGLLDESVLHEVGREEASPPGVQRLEDRPGVVVSVQVDHHDPEEVPDGPEKGLRPTGATHARSLQVRNLQPQDPPSARDPSGPLDADGAFPETVAGAGPKDEGWLRDREPTRRRHEEESGAGDGGPLSRATSCRGFRLSLYCSSRP